MTAFMNSEIVIENGIIVKGIGGFYYVETAGELYECRARGLFRREDISPLTGDRVRITVRENGENTIDGIYERTSVLKRPPVANIDRLFVVVSVCEPSPNMLITDKLIAIAEDKKIEPAIVITKADMGKSAARELKRIYSAAGFVAVETSCALGEGLDEIYRELCGHISAFAGNSGVGKSSLLNALEPSLALQTGEISRKLGRGRHTTRQTELFSIGGGYVADTPGFAFVELEGQDMIPKENLPFCFREFLPYLGECRFSTCAHIGDKGCRILEAVESGNVPRTRHESYVAMYNEVKDVADWQIRGN